MTKERVPDIRPLFPRRKRSRSRSKMRSRSRRSRSKGSMSPGEQHEEGEDEELDGTDELPLVGEEEEGGEGGEEGQEAEHEVGGRPEEEGVLPQEVVLLKML